MQHKIIEDDDKDIDYSDIPELDDDFWAGATWHQGSDLISIKVDPEIRAWFQLSLSDYQTQINAALKIYIKNYKQITELLEKNEQHT